ncbi:AfsR/SARP family transcriptional regulator [Saccharothrix stipae]
MLGTVDVFTGAPHRADEHGDVVEFDGPSAALLTVLALHRGERVSKQYLHEAVWHGAVAVNAVETTVARVRHRLGLRARDNTFLVTDRSGYRLAARSDIQGFEEEARLGDQALRTGMNAEALAFYDAALALWRGAPGAGLLDDALDVRPALEELHSWHWAVQVHRLKALTKLERWDSVLRTADRLLAREPHTERLLLARLHAVEHLKGASSAYDALTAAVRAMRDDLGAEPSQDLRAYRTRLLATMTPSNDSIPHEAASASEPALETRVEPSGAAPGTRLDTAVDHNLPAPTYFTFVPRPHTKRIQEALTAGLPIISLVGIGGNGKSTLAREFAFAIATAADPFKLIVWVSDKEVPGSTTLPLVLDEIALTAGLRELTATTHAGKIQQVNRMLRQNPALIVIDNFETIVDQELIDWLPTVPYPSRVLITSIVRPRAVEQYCLEIEVGGLGEKERHSFLAQLLIRHNLRDLRADSDAISEIWAASYGNPKLVEWALGQYRSRGRSLRSIADEITRTRTRATTERLGGDFVLEELFRSSWKEMTDDEAQVLLAASLFPHGCATETVHEVAGIDVRFADTIESLTNLCFLSRQARDDDQSPWYAAEPLVRMRLAGHFAVDVTDVEDRFFRYWTNFTASIGFCPHDVTRLLKLDIPGTRENLEYAIWLAAESGRHHDVIRIAREARYYYYVRGFWSEERNIHLLRAEAAKSISDHTEEFDARVYFINIASKQENLTAVEKQNPRLTELIRRYGSELDSRSVGEYRHAYALYLLAKGDYTEAEDLWRENLLDVEALGPANHNANLRWLAICIARGSSARSSEALEIFASARAQADQFGYKRARFLIDLEQAQITLSQQPSRSVIGHLLRMLTGPDALEQLTLLGDRRYEADHQWLLAGCHEHLGDYGLAIERREKAAELYDSLGLIERAAIARRRGDLNA